VLRLLDLLFVAKDEDGTIRQLAADDDEDFGGLPARIVPVDDAGPGGTTGRRRRAGLRSG
jgi:hypothetical protein